MTQKTMTIIIAVTLVILIVFVYIYSVPPRTERIGPAVKEDTVIIKVDSVSHTVAIDK